MTEIRQKYNRLARWYNVLDGLPEVLGVKTLRRGLLRQASGRVLEVAAGTGRNFRHYPKTCQVTGVDFSPSMLEIARKEAHRPGLKVRFLLMDAENLVLAARPVGPAPAETP